MINKANKKLGWGILGTGMIAQWFSADLPKSATSRIILGKGKERVGRKKGDPMFALTVKSIDHGDALAID